LYELEYKIARKYIRITSNEDGGLMEDYEDIVDYNEDILLKDDIFLSSLVGGFGPLDLEAGTGLCTREGNLQ
jgi:hypothetical protein